MGVEAAAYVVGSLIAGNEFIRKPAEDRRDEMISANKKAEDQQKTMIKEAQDKAKRDEMAAAAIAARDAGRARQTGRSASGRQGTILTSPIGLTGAATSARKTLIGQ